MKGTLINNSLAGDQRLSRRNSYRAAHDTRELRRERWAPDGDLAIQVGQASNQGGGPGGPLPACMIGHEDPILQFSDDWSYHVNKNFFVGVKLSMVTCLLV